MKTHVLRLSAMLVSLAIAFPALGQDVAPDLSVRISLLDSTVCMHEPARFAITITNRSDSKVAMNLGSRSEEFIEVATKQGDLQWKIGKQSARSGFAGLGIVRIKPGEEKTVTYIADKWTGGLSEGTHELRVKVNIPATGREWDPPSDLALAGPGQQEAVFQLLVIAPCPAKMAALAEADLATISGSASVENKQKASEHLSYIDDDAAIPFMERAIIQNGIGNRDIMDGLQRLGDKKAQEALTRLSTNADSEIAAYARLKLSNLSKQS